jgi:hypothetical protein
MQCPECGSTSISKNGKQRGKQNGVAEKRDESGRNRNIPELELVQEQSNGMFQHLLWLGVAQRLAMESR